MKKILMLFALSPLAVCAQQTPAHVLQSQQAAYQQQQWLQQQQMLGQIQHERMMQEQQAAVRQAARQSAPGQQEIVPAHLRPQWQDTDSFGFIYVGFNPNAFPDNTSSPGSVGYDSLPDADTAAKNAQRLCFERGTAHPDECQLLFSYRNMCGSVAQGKLRNGRGVRLYPSLALVQSKAAADEAALANCRADGAVNPDSCMLPGSVGESCANAGSTLQ